MALTREALPSGELILTDGQGVYGGKWVPKHSQRAKKTFGEPFAQVFLAGAGRLARDPRLTASDHRVLWALIERMEQGEAVFESDPAGIGRDIGMHVRQVGRALTHLAALGIISRPAHGRVALDEELLWRGTSEQRARWRKEREMEQSP